MLSAVSQFFPKLLASVFDCNETEGLKFQDAKNHFCCEVCALPLSVDSVCLSCLAAPCFINKSRVPFIFKSDVRKSVLDFKYHEQLYLGRMLAENWIQNVTISAAELTEIDAFIPVPIHPDRLIERGFNQSLELANQFSKHFEIPVCTRCVKRVKHTEQQTTLTKQARIRNLKGAFKLEVSLFERLKKVVIVDDVLTTGTTVNELAKLLKSEAGVQEVEVWCIARATL